MKAGLEDYSEKFVEESLGLAKGVVESGSLPSELVQAVGAAVAGREDARAENPVLDSMLLRSLEDIEKRSFEVRGFSVRKARWPGGASFAACLTHDVDNVDRPWSHIRERRDRFSAWDYWTARLGLKSLYNNISYASGMEAKRGVRSSFYLLSSNYDLTRMASELRTLESDGWDVGLHGDTGTHDSEDRMKEAVTKFRERTGIEPKGLREHYLRFDYGATWSIAQTAGFEYDTTVGNTDRLGFRLGLCTPFHPPDEEWRPRPLLEIPLALMDTTLWGYLKKTEEEGRRDFRAMTRSVKEVNGLFTLLWHTESMRMKGGRIYPALLDELRATDCYIANGRSVAGWWNARAAPLLLDDDGFRMPDSPAGLCLDFKAKDGRRVVAEGGTVEKRGDTTVVRATSGHVGVRLE